MYLGFLSLTIPKYEKENNKKWHGGLLKENPKLLLTKVISIMISHSVNALH